MLFNSFLFATFFLVFVVLYFCIPFRFRLILLLVASYLFYASWNPNYLILIALTTLIVYWSALAMAKCIKPDQKKPFLLFVIISNLGILMVFKYYNFFSGAIWSVFSGAQDKSPFLLDIVLPVGISFYTFQAIAYAVDVYNGKCPAEKNPVRFAVFISFFPQLIIGPIERARDLMPQFYENHRYDFQRVKTGGILIVRGLFKKMVVADKITAVLLPTFSDPTFFSAGTLWITCFASAVMIYADFSGYTDIARGCARVLGYRLVENFKQPFFSPNFSQFWNRWHISMTSWFQTYTFWPIVNRYAHTKLHLQFITIFVFSLIGLWHGATWNCILWGTCSGILLVFGNLSRKRRDSFYKKVCTRLAGGTPSGWSFKVLWKIRSIGAVVITLSIFCLMTPLFLSPTLDHSLMIYREMLSNPWPINIRGLHSLYELPLAGLGIFILFFIDFLETRNPIVRLEDLRPTVVRWACYLGLILIILMFGEFDQHAFFYFQF